MKQFILAAFLTVALLSPAIANDLPANTSARAILTQQQDIRADALAGKGRYKDMDQKVRQDLFAKQDIVKGLLEGRELTSELSQLDQVTLFNSLEAISAIVNKAEDERMICRRERTTGSHRAQNVCKTVAQIRKERDMAESVMGSRDVRCSGKCESAAEGW